MRTPSRDDQDLYDQCVALQATIEELTGAKVRLSTIVDMQSLQNKHLQATIEELEADGVEVRKVTGNYIRSLKAQLGEANTTITELTGVRDAAKEEVVPVIKCNYRKLPPGYLK